jgi:hypothetical protein
MATLSPESMGRLSRLFQAGTLPDAETLLMLELWGERSGPELHRMDESGELVLLLVTLALPLRFAALYRAKYPDRSHDHVLGIAGLPPQLPPDDELVREAREVVEISCEPPEGAFGVTRDERRTE